MTVAEKRRRVGYVFFGSDRVCQFVDFAAVEIFVHYVSKISSYRSRRRRVHSGTFYTRHETRWNRTVETKPTGSWAGREKTPVYRKTSRFPDTHVPSAFGHINLGCIKRISVRIPGPSEKLRHVSHLGARTKLIRTAVGFSIQFFRAVCPLTEYGPQIFGTNRSYRMNADRGLNTVRNLKG